MGVREEVDVRVPLESYKSVTNCLKGTLGWGQWVLYIYTFCGGIPTATGTIRVLDLWASQTICSPETGVCSCKPPSKGKWLKFLLILLPVKPICDFFAEREIGKVITTADSRPKTTRGHNPGLQIYALITQDFAGVRAKSVSANTNGESRMRKMVLFGPAIWSFLCRSVSLSW